MNARRFNAIHVGMALTLLLFTDAVFAQDTVAPPFATRTTVFSGTMQHCSSLNVCTVARIPTLGELSASDGGTSSISLTAGGLASLMASLQMGSVTSLGDHFRADVNIISDAVDIFVDNIRSVQGATSTIGPMRVIAGINVAEFDLATVATHVGITTEAASGLWEVFDAGSIDLQSMRIGGSPITGHFPAGTQIPVSGPISVPAISLGPLNLGSQQQLFNGTMTVQKQSQALDPSDGDFIIYSIVPLDIVGAAPDGLGGIYNYNFRIGETDVRRSLVASDGTRVDPSTIRVDTAGLAGLTIVPHLP